MTQHYRQDWTAAGAKARKAAELRQQAKELEARAMRLRDAAHLWRRVDELHAMADAVEAGEDVSKR